MNKKEKYAANYNIQSYYNELMAFVLQRVRSPSLAADIVQETYLRFYVKLEHRLNIEQFQPLSNPRAYLYRIAGNLIIDEGRKNTVRNKYITEEITHDVKNINEIHVDRVIEDRQNLKYMAIAISELPPKCKQVFKLRKLEHKSVEAISISMGISRNMVEKHLRKALLHCRKRITEMENE